MLLPIYQQDTKVVFVADVIMSERGKQSRKTFLILSKQVDAQKTGVQEQPTTLKMLLPLCFTWLAPEKYAADDGMEYYCPHFINI